MAFHDREADRWSREAFLREACALMVTEMDWDSLDSGRLHHATSVATDLAGVPVIVGVLDDDSRLSAVLDDAAAERRDSGHRTPHYGSMFRMTWRWVHARRRDS
jgi:hypothetical protein